jgi:hypothetical protein
MTMKKPYVTCLVAVVSAIIVATFVANTLGTLGLERVGIIGGAGGVMIARKKGE